MKLAIVTAYHPITNHGSFLQAYSLSKVLRTMGNEVYFVRTVPNLKTSINNAVKLIPRRGFLHRFTKVFYAESDLRKLHFVDVPEINGSFSCVIFGSDEIWNIKNRFFLKNVFWETGEGIVPRITYAMSVGHAELKDFTDHPECSSQIKRFSAILYRDKHSGELLKNFTDLKLQQTVDPTLLVSLNDLCVKCQLPSKPYLLVYTYGVDGSIVANLKHFAKKEGLEIVSACFYHMWADRNIESSALSLAYLMKNAKYVFTTTFHGAIFALRTHSQCGILPLRDKVRDICYQLQSEDRILKNGFTQADLRKVLKTTFRDNEFEDNLKKKQEISLITLSKTLQNLMKEDKLNP